MKYLLLLVLFLVPFKSHADVSLSYVSLMLQGMRFTMSPMTPKETTIRVAGVGKDRDAAIQNGLLTAVQQTVGVMLITDQVVNNDRLLKNVVAQYSSGTVNKFQVHDCVGNRPVVCNMTVTVSLSAFMRKLENVSDNIQIPGNDYYQKHLLQKTLLIQREKMLDYYLRQIHQSGLDVEITNVELLPTTGDNARLSIQYRVKWNETFRKEFLSFMRKLENDTQHINGSTVYMQWGTTGLADNRAYIKTHSEVMHNNVINLIHRPIQVQFLNVCETIGVENIFDLGRRGLNLKSEISVSPDKLKNMTHLAAKIGCDS
jgi:hypothetical protein